MKQTLYLAWRYLTYHRLKTGILITSITLILFLPIGLRVLVDQSSQQLTARAVASPLIVGAKGSQLELVLNTLYFRSDFPEPIPYRESIAVQESQLAWAIPVYVRFQAQGHPIVGTTLDYFPFRGLHVARGRQMAMLGECVVGSSAAAAMGVAPGRYVISSPENVFDIAGVYPLKMKVAGVLAFSDGPDDDAVFVDIKTAWIIQGLGHGHQDLARPEAAGGVLERAGGRITANGSVVQYNEITEENVDSFHFHGDISDNPITAVIAIPFDEKASAILQGRYQAEDRTMQIVRPAVVMDELLDNILTIQNFVVAGAVVVGIATLATTILVFLLSLRLRRREIETLVKIGGSQGVVGSLMISEIIGVLVISVVLAGGLTFLTAQFGSLVIRAVIRA